MTTGLLPWLVWSRYIYLMLTNRGEGNHMTFSGLPPYPATHPFLKDMWGSCSEPQSWQKSFDLYLLSSLRLLPPSVGKQTFGPRLSWRPSGMCSSLSAFSLYTNDCTSRSPHVKVIFYHKILFCISITCPNPQSLPMTLQSSFSLETLMNLQTDYTSSE